MLNIKDLRKNPQYFIEKLKLKNFKKNTINSILDLDSKLREKKHQTDCLINEKNKETNISICKNIKKEIESNKEIISSIEKEIKTLSLELPNIPHDLSPIGDSSNNKIVESFGEKPYFSYKPKTHLELEGIDIKKSAKISGNGFYFLSGDVAKLQRKLINSMIGVHISYGYNEIRPPYLVREEILIGTGQLPKFKDDLYKIEGEDLWLIPTAEVPLTNIHKDEIIDAKELPLKYCAYSPCFRREAGSYGKDSYGISRLHQFDKVELVQFVHPNNSENAHLEMLNQTKELLERLNLHYRVLELSTEDMSSAAHRCFDIEVWAPGLNRYLEVSSCSNFLSYQAIRSNIKYKENNKKEYLHTLNTSALALPRLIIAIMETYQTEFFGFEYSSVNML